MPVLARPTIAANENSPYLVRSARPVTAGPNAPATPAQAGFIRSLLADRDIDSADRALQGLIDAFRDETLTKGNASKLIDALKKRSFRSAAPVAPAEPIPAPARATAPEGFHVLVGPAGPAFYKVKTSRSSNRPYAMMWDGESWDYEQGRGVVRQLSESTLADAEAAKMFADSYHCCMFCLQELTDQRSIDAGYGPTCAGNRGLPWG